MQSLDGKVAIVTGGAGGVGRATAILLAKLGARVAVADVKDGGGLETVAMVQGAGGEAICVETDLTSAAQVEALVEETVAAFGAVHILHNNAAVHGTHRTFDDVSIEAWRQVVDINLTSYFIVTRAVVPVMRGQGGGVIVNTTSGAGISGYAHGLAYSASKGGINALTYALAASLSRDGIRVNGVSPNARVDTPMQDGPPDRMEALRRSGQLMDPMDVARAVAYVACDEDLNGAIIAVSLSPDGVRFARLTPPGYEPVEDVP